MPERDYRLYLFDILDSGQAIQSYVDNLDFEHFHQDRMRFAAVIREFEVIGEAVGKLPEKNSKPNIQMCLGEISRIFATCLSTSISV